jgi:transaldolase
MSDSSRASDARASGSPTRQLHDIGQSLWLDNITRTMLADGTLRRYIDEFDVTGLTSNPTIFDKAITGGDAYDEQIAASSASSPEELFFELALTDLREAADLFAEIHKRTEGVDGWASLEVSPLLADDAEATVEQARRLHEQGERDNLYIKIPGTQAGRQAIEESIFAGVPINVTLLFSTDHYLDAADAYMRGVERRIEAGLDPAVSSVASLFVSRWDRAVAGEVPEELSNGLGIAVAKRTYRAYRSVLLSVRWQHLANQGARPQRLLWASTGTKDPAASDVLYVEALAAPLTINTMPEETLLAFADHGKVLDPLSADGEDAEEVLARFAAAGIDVSALAARLQEEGKEAFDASWKELLESISSERQRLAKA